LACQRALDSASIDLDPSGFGLGAKCGQGAVGVVIDAEAEASRGTRSGSGNFQKLGLLHHSHLAHSDAVSSSRSAYSSPLSAIALGKPMMAQRPASSISSSCVAAAAYVARPPMKRNRTRTHMR